MPDFICRPSRTRSPRGRSGYYYSVQVFDPKTHRYRNPTPAEAERMAEEDRKLFTEGGKPLAGREAVRSVERHWADSNITRLKLGRSMAINTMARCKPSSGVKPITKSKSPKNSKPAKSGPAAEKTPAGRTGTSSAKSPRQTVHILQCIDPKRPKKEKEIVKESTTNKDLEALNEALVEAESLSALISSASIRTDTTSI